MFHPGERIAERFEVEALLGEGGLAQVYRVRHTTLGTTHALKLLTMSHQSLVERLLQEGRIQAQLRHPNIIGVSDVITVRGMPGLLLEYVDCDTLEVALGQRGRLPLDEALDLFAAVLAGVATAHAAGVLHRDLKPANILLARTPNGVVPKVSDFGIAKIAAGDSNPGLTRAGSAMGTPGYVAPEQMEDASNVDLRADIFSLGTILYELVTGQRAFPSKSMRETLNAAASGRYPPPEQVQPDLPPEVARAIRVAMAPEPEDRFQTCYAFAEALYAEMPARLAVVKEKRGSATPAPATLWGRTGSWTPTPSGPARGEGTWQPESRSAETLAPSTQGAVAGRPGLLSRLPSPPPLARGLLIVGLGGLLLLALLTVGLLVGQALKQRDLPRAADPTTESVSPSTASPEASSSSASIAPTSATAPASPDAAPTAAPTTSSSLAAPSSASSASAGPEAASAPTTAASAHGASDATHSAAAPTTSSTTPWTGATTSSSSPEAGEQAASASPTSGATEPAAAEIPRLVGTWSGDPWRITLLDQQGTQVGGYIYRGSTGTRIEVEGSYDAATGTLLLNGLDAARYRLTAKVDGRWLRGTYTQGQGEINTPFSARRTTR